MKVRGYLIVFFFFFVKIQYERGWKCWNIQIKGKGKDEIYEMITARDTSVRTHAHTYTHTHRSSYPLPVVGCFASSLILCYSSHDTSVWKSIIRDSFYQVSVAFSAFPHGKRLLWHRNTVKVGSNPSWTTVDYLILKNHRVILCCGHILWMQSFLETYNTSLIFGKIVADLCLNLRT